MRKQKLNVLVAAIILGILCAGCYGFGIFTPKTASLLDPSVKVTSEVFEVQAAKIRADIQRDSEEYNTAYAIGRKHLDKQALSLNKIKVALLQIGVGGLGVIASGGTFTGPYLAGFALQVFGLGAYKVQAKKRKDEAEMSAIIVQAVEQERKVNGQFKASLSANIENALDRTKFTLDNIKEFTDNMKRKPTA